MQGANPKLRWYQYRLRTLLIVLTVFTVGVGLLHRYVEGQRESTRAQQVVAAKLEQTGATITWEPRGSAWIRRAFGEEGFRDVVAVQWQESFNIAIGPFFRFPGVKQVDVGNDDLAQLRHFEKLRELTLESRQITDSDLTYLQQLPHLEKMSVLLNSPLTSDGLRSLRHLKHVELSLSFHLQWTEEVQQRLEAFESELPHCKVSVRQ